MKLSDNHNKAAERRTLFTIGHSNLDLNLFAKLLKNNAIEVLVDVRSNPYSRFAFQFNKDNIQKAIQENGIQYLFLGKELGGRPKDIGLHDLEGHDKISSRNHVQRGKPG